MESKRRFSSASGMAPGPRRGAHPSAPENGAAAGVRFKYDDPLRTLLERAKMMAKDLKDRSKVDELTVTIVEKGEPRDWTSKWSGTGGRVCDAVGEDESGDKVNLTLWNDDIEKVQVNTKIKITNGWASSFKNKLQVSAGKYGKLEIL
mgnify:FL=1